MGLPPILRFAPHYFERIWGGTRLHDVLGMPTPADRTIGEAWLISDHPHCESVVLGGPLAGATLRELVRDHGPALLGTAKPTPDGRFPLLLKLLDSGDLLSVQVHPDDAAAERLGEPDVGKTEMWHVIDAAPGAQVICGLKSGVDRAKFEEAIRAGASAECMQDFDAPTGTSVLVTAGTVHAIGGGLLIAEIQQNSDITYRIYDWDRVDAAGKPRELHIDTALEVIDFGAGAQAVRQASGGAREVLAECRYFSVECVRPAATPLPLGGHGFQIVLATQGNAILYAEGEVVMLKRGEAALIPAAALGVTVAASAEALVYRAGLLA